MELIDPSLPQDVHQLFVGLYNGGVMLMGFFALVAGVATTRLVVN